jgi:hypothetical protein
MRRIWPSVYLVGAIACVVVGYHGLASKSAVHQETSWNFVAENFLIFFVYPIGIVALRRVFRGDDSLRRPSQFVKPTNNPLQLVRVMLVGFAAIGLGGSVALPWATPKSFMLFWTNFAGVLGLFLAEQIIYRVWSKKITP